MLRKYFAQTILFENCFLVRIKGKKPLFSPLKPLFRALPAIVFYFLRESQNLHYTALMIIESTFKPAWWLPGGHLQTLWPTLAGRQITLTAQRERIELPDADFVDVDWLNQNGKGPLTIVLHGLEGSLNSPYAKGIARSLALQDHVVAFMHFRGCSGEHNRHDRAYHSGDTADFAYVATLLKQRYADKKLAVVGYSLGGNVLLKWLGETGLDNPIDCAVAVSVPFQLGKLATKMNRGFSKIYQEHFMRKLRSKMLTKFTQRPAPICLETLKRSKTFREFDNLVTAPLHQFADADDYYSRSSCRQYIPKIQKQTLIIHAKNDPFMIPEVIPEQHELPQNVTLELANCGGHVGFISGNLPGKANYWLEQRIPHHIDKTLGFKD